MKVIISEDVRTTYPDLRLAFLEINGMRIGSVSDKLTQRIRESAQMMRDSLDLDKVKDRPDFRAYRDFFWKIKVDPTKTRPAAEALVRRILKNATLPRINDFVDSYNIASAETGIPIAAFDIEILEEPAILRMSKEGEQFFGIGMTEKKSLEAGLPVMSSGGSLIAVYPYRDADDSKITSETTDALVITCGVPGIPLDTLIEAAKKSRDNILSICGGHASKIETA
ncbi:MAG: phenylalanine--tRNA ligase beta subunit-related protein [Thermoplasmata archaeon]|nr:phenylalanine--tRNA ligase beta subunit-related protein [Thermoplasmata archaeon]